MKKMNKTMRTWLLCLYALLPLASMAQCGIENTAFKSGESLSYELFFNWKFIWMRVGTAQMDTKMTKFEGKDAWMSYLITRGNEKLDKYFTKIGKKNFSFAVESFDYQRYTQISEEISIPTTIQLRGFDFMKKELARCAEEGIEWIQGETVWTD